MAWMPSKRSVACLPACQLLLPGILMVEGAGKVGVWLFGGYLVAIWWLLMIIDDY